MPSQPFVCYRLPGETEPTTISQTGNDLQLIDSHQDLLSESGFVVWPWEKHEDYPAVLIRPDAVSKGWGALEGLTPEIQLGNPYIAGYHEYEQQINQIKAAIDAGQIEKAILSRIMLHTVDDSFNAIETFKKLCDTYPDVFCYLVSIPETGTWMGATPEYLLKIDKDTLETVSLAGSQKDKDLPLDSVDWGEKELHEQQVVTDAIQQRLQQYFTQPAVANGPITISTGAVLHLKTTFQLDLSKEPAGNINAFLKDLHPTPAIGGKPKAEALKLIRKIEKHQRGYYTGFLGPVNMNDSTHLFVNLRCMQLLQNQLALYLGGGITSGSTAQAEWEETELKARTLLGIVK